MTEDSELTSYDSISVEDYIAHVERPLSWNNLYERPSVIARLPDLQSKNVLDIGCAEGFFVIQAALRGAERAIGCDITESRLRIARIVAKAWQLQDRVRFSATSLYDIPPKWASDIVLCFAVVHHLHGSPGDPGFHDTWQMISNPDKYAILNGTDCQHE